MQKIGRFSPIVFALFGLYLIGYAASRVTVLHAVERYTGADGKSGPRQDFITKRDRPAGEGWEYQVFLPVIKVEEGITNFFHNRQR